MKRWIVAVAAVLLLVLSRQAGAPQVEAVPLTSEPGLELEPRLSPNGSRVADELAYILRWYFVRNAKFFRRLWFSEEQCLKDR